ncbi:G2/mitotic-specific cyclin-B [Drosophila hydei]|uniref:G2/mitotic-specific cyclin-B n=1 Tax=Drosophila hydei TaxID=7224 RepID=A0A6J1ML95_DROHY|nr:G2/mitotic-specific cyclin-B [Drosophila hydei]
MMSTAPKMIMDENATEKYNQVQVKKLTVPSNEANTKRAAFGDLQNRGLNRGIVSKEAAQKELKDVKLTKARVDTHWKKQPLGLSNANANVNANANANAGVATKPAGGPLLRSNSMRTNLGQIGRQISSRPAATTTATAKVAADPNNKLAKQKSISDEKVNTLRREDSNLSRKSLTKLRAALAKPTAAASTAAAAAVAKKEPLVPRAQPRTAANALAVKKDATATAAVVVQPKKEIVSVSKLPSKLRTVPATTSQANTLMSLSTKRLEVEDIDADDGENLVLVSEYVNDIYDYLYELEEQQPIYTDHLANQLEVSYKMRAVLIDWINEVHLQFHLAAETFHLAVAIIDRYLQVVKDTRRKYLQLVGVTALFIATKYEELFPPAIGDFVFITDDTYTGQEIRQMEMQILKAIDNNLSRPLPIHFLRRYSKAASAEDEHHAMSKYFLELAGMDYELASYKPSEIAAASLFLSLHLLNGNSRAATGFSDRHWTPTLVHYSRYTAAYLRPIARQIAKLARDAPTAKLRAIYTKYQANKFQKIALRPELSSPLLDSIVGKK